MRLRRIVGPLVALALLAGCASQDASGIAAHAPGHPLSDVERCLGVPTRKDTVGGVEPNMAGTTVLEWDFSETSTAASSVLDSVMPPVTSLVTPLTAALFPSSSLQCRAVAGVNDGWVTSFTLSGDTSGISGPNAGCDPLLRGCRFFRTP